jgi:hypothetical protein
MDGCSTLLRLILTYYYHSWTRQNTLSQGDRREVAIYISICGPDIGHRWILNYTCETIGVKTMLHISFIILLPHISVSEQHAEAALDFGLSFMEPNGKSGHASQWLCEASLITSQEFLSLLSHY